MPVNYFASMPRICGCCVTLALFALVNESSGADRIVLRNLEILTDRTVKAFDEDGIQLDDGRLLTWDVIEKAKVASRQAEFDQMLNELGTHLYRIRQRLKVGDYRGLVTHANALFARYAGRQSDTAYMVCQALMWGRIAAGQREAALEPYLRCFAWHRRCQAEGRPVPLPGERRLQLDLEQGLTSELPPVWFDGAAAKKALPGVTAAIAALDSPRPPGIYTYLASLALAADQPDVAAQAVKNLQGMQTMQAILAAQAEVMKSQSGSGVQLLRERISELDAEMQPLALYWLGRARLVDSDRRVRDEGLLDLLKIVAVFGEDQPELAAAGLYEAMQVLARDGDSKGSIAVRRELLDRYGQTWHAALARKQEKR
jgi:hypothetical protein